MSLSDDDRAERITHELREKPSLYYRVLVRGHADRVLGPWEHVASIWWSRRNVAGERVLDVQLQTGTLSAWKWRAKVEGAGRINLDSMMLAREDADNWARADVGTGHYILAGGTGRDLTPWLPDGGDGERGVPVFHREDNAGEMVAWVGNSASGGWYGVVWGESIDGETGPLRVDSAEAAQSMVDDELVRHGYDLDPDGEW